MHGFAEETLSFIFYFAVLRRVHGAAKLCEEVRGPIAKKKGRWRMHFEVADDTPLATVGGWVPASTEER